MITHDICKMLGIRYPIFQGAMAWIADADLAAAVSNAGGLGIIAAGNAPVDSVLAEIRKAKTLTDKPFGLNIMMLSPFADDIFRIAMEEGVAVVTTGAGNPAKYIPALKEHGIKVIPVVPSVALAKRMEDSGADMLVAEGMEAGGHIGKLTTMAMVPQIADAVSIPVIAAGGIADGRGMAAAFMLGARGVQIGTRFVVAAECNAHQNYKNMIIKAKDIDTAVTGQITGHPVRVLRSKLSRRFEELERAEAKKDTPDIAAINSLGAGGLRLAAKDGDIENGSFMSGQIAGLVTHEQTVSEIIEDIMGGFNSLMRKPL